MPPASRLRLLAALAALAWGLLILELCTTTKVKTGTWFLLAPWLFNLSHAPLFGTLAAFLGLALRAGPEPASAPTPAPTPAPRSASSVGGAAGAWRALLARVPSPDGAARAAFGLAAVLAVCYGIAIEWIQAGIPGRSASVLDVLTDTVGALGVPWALSSGRVFGARALVVFVAAGAAAAWSTWG